MQGLCSSFLFDFFHSVLPLLYLSISLPLPSLLKRKIFNIGIIASLEERISLETSFTTPAPLQEYSAGQNQRFTVI
jgi:hypothetical protein